MFTLIHLAKDNGLRLYFCKVEPDELVQVSRPAIFHQKDHFVFIKNGDPMPSGDYDGYVLTERPLNEPLPYSLAKKIRGRKNVGQILQPIAIGFASLVNPVLGTLVGAGFGAATAAGAFGDQGEGEWWRIATGGLSGATAASSPFISAVSAAAGEVPGAIKSGNWMAPISAGLGQYGSNLFAGGFGQGYTSAPTGSSFLGKLSSGFQGGVGSITNKIQSLAGGTTPGGGVELAPGSTGIPTPSGYSGTYTLPGIGNKVVGIPGLAGPANLGGSASIFAGGGTTPQLPGSPGGFDLSKILTGANGLKLLGAGLSTTIPKPELGGNATENLSKAAEYLGLDNFQALPQATRAQLDKYVNTSLADLSQEFYAPDDKGIRQLEERKQQSIDSLMVQYANYGQDPYSSTQARQELDNITTQYDQAIAEYQQQVQNQAMAKAIDFKLDILGKSMAQGNFDYESAMELATYMGRDNELRYAMEVKDYDALQNVLAEIFSLKSTPQQNQNTYFDMNRGFVTA